MWRSLPMRHPLTCAATGRTSIVSPGFSSRGARATRYNCGTCVKRRRPTTLDERIPLRPIPTETQVLTTVPIPSGTFDRPLSEPPAAPAPGAFRLLRYFAIASLIAILLAALGLGLFFRQTALKQLIKVGEDNNVALA